MPAIEELLKQNGQTPTRFSLGASRGALLPVFTLCLLAACAEPTPPANYEQPTAAEALGAILAGVKADHIDRPAKLVRLNREARNPAERWTQFENDVARDQNEQYARMHADLIRIENLDCACVSFRRGDVPEVSSARLASPPKAAYRCSFIFRYRPDPTLGALMAPEGEGYFYKEGREFLYFGSYEHPY